MTDACESPFQQAHGAILRCSRSNNTRAAGLFLYLLIHVITTFFIGLLCIDGSTNTVDQLRGSINYYYETINQ